MAVVNLEKLDGKKLKKLRQELEYTQTQLGYELGYSLRAIQNYEGGQREIPKHFKKHLELYILYKEGKMNLNLNELTAEQQESFTEQFYELWNENFDFEDDLDGGNNPRPWGCPWYSGSDIQMSASSLKELVKKYFDAYKDEIKDLVENNES